MINIREIEFSIIIVLAISFLLSIYFIISKKRGAYGYFLLNFSLLVSYTSVYLFARSIVSELRDALLISHIANAGCATAILFFSFEHTNQKQWMRFPRILLFFIEPIISFLLIMIFFANEHGSGFISSFNSNFLIGVDYLESFYITSLLIIGVIVFAPKNSARGVISRFRRVLFFCILCIPLLPKDLEPNYLFSSVNSEIFLFISSSLLMSVNLIFMPAAEIVPLSRKRVVDHMHEGWIVVNSENRVIDINSFAKEILNVQKKKIYGVHVRKVFFRWPNIAKILESGKDADIRGSFSRMGRFLHLHVKVLHIKDSTGSIIGRLILIRDHTEHRQVEESRQLARDEMFSLLHSISGAASRSENTIEFITASMYQMAYSFMSKSIAIFLSDTETESDQRFLLVAHQGIEDNSLEGLAFIERREMLVSEILKSRKPIQIKNTGSDARVSVALINAFREDLLLVPIISEDDFLGLVLISCEDANYSDNEITRLEIVAEQVGSFVRNERRRHIASTLSERQRLIRDLHDSVTQRLYALVMTAEAANLGMKSGNISQSGKIIAQLSLHAHQALKEMRLFLHKLQPIDLEREGLAAVLMHRLEAVEGRAGLERTIDIDDNLGLSPEEELSLFFITQEALNNIIKHANASFIKVKLKKSKEGILLEVHDNGKGFEFGKINNYGLGLNNMFERAKKIGAKLKISSALNEGTRIVVSLDYADSPRII
ncbi:MAG: hypothetical protein GY755_03055 [Chloroflexi bacterium]|nr:hypothetical protein [Chloroflexota bacterium]